MDPLATLQRIADAINDLDLSGWYSAMLDLANWLANGGFSPWGGSRQLWQACQAGLEHVETWLDGTKIELTYADLNVFQRYWWGQWDPLYAVLSRRGNSVDRVTVTASADEIWRLLETARKCLQSDDPGERRTARAFLHRLYEVVL